MVDTNPVTEFLDKIIEQIQITKEVDDDLLKLFDHFKKSEEGNLSHGDLATLDKAQEIISKEVRNDKVGDLGLSLFGVFGHAVNGLVQEVTGLDPSEQTVLKKLKKVKARREVQISIGQSRQDQQNTKPTLKENFSMFDTGHTTNEAKEPDKSPAQIKFDPVKPN